MEVFSDVTGGNPKLKASGYASAGKFPVIDQGKAAIAGYSDDASLLARVELPVVIFGDHTRAVKYVDHPFVMGADGTKVLRPRASEDPRYLYHYLRSINLQNAGYSRHFKFLKELSVPLPPLEEQRRIAAILDKTEELRNKRQAALVQLESLSAAHVEVLLSQEAWPRRQFGELCRRVTVGVVVKPASHYVNDGVPALRSLNVRAGRLDMTNLVHFSKESHDGPLRKSQLAPGDVVTVRTGNAGTSAVVPADIGPLNAIDLIISTALPSLMTPDYAVAFLNSDAGRRMVLGERRGQIQQHFNVKSLQSAVIPVPPIGQQQLLGSRLAQVNKLKRVQVTQLIELNTLVASLQQRAYNMGIGRSRLF